jgi:hypothetical protein
MTFLESFITVEINRILRKEAEFQKRLKKIIQVPQNQ